MSKTTLFRALDRVTSLDLYRASERALYNRRVLADAANRSCFKPREIWRYIGVVLAFPFLRAVWQLRYPVPVIEGDKVMFGSRKRPAFRPGIDDHCVMDDLEYDWVEETWRFLTLRVALRYYLAILGFMPFIMVLLVRRTAWAAAHFAVTVLEWVYLREIVRRHQSTLHTVYCGYYIDRKAFALALVRREFGVRHVGVQHGAFNMFPYLHRAQCDEIFLMYPFSKPFAERFFACTTDDIHIAPEMFDLGWRTHGSEKPFVVYASSADQTEVNRGIVAALDARLPGHVAIFVKPHPRDQRAWYTGLMGGRVDFVDHNAPDAAAYVGRVSSVMAEAYTFGIPVFLFSGASPIETDFISCVNPPTYTDLDTLAQAVAKRLSTNLPMVSR